MAPARPPATGLPDPGQARTLDDLAERLTSLKVWAGDPSYETIKERVNAAWSAAGRPATDLVGKTTVVDCFRAGRRRLNPDLVVAVVQVLHPDPGYTNQWRQALQVVSARSRSAGQVRVEDRLPVDPDGFTGRTGELQRLRAALAPADGAVVAITGMAGVGKTRLAVHAAHRHADDRPADRVLAVDLRGFHPDPAQPPADPAAVLEGFLRLLGVPGSRIPTDLSGRVRAYRERLAERPTLVLLDNAADTAQVAPLLPPAGAAIVTSRRVLAGLRPTAEVDLGAFTPAEARAFLDRAAAAVPAGSDPDAAERIAERCGYLPLALDLMAGRMRATPGWTRTDHAERLDERHRDRTLDTGVELAFDLSYRNLPADRARLLRLVALHPGQDFDPYAAAALAGTDPADAAAELDRLHHEQLLQLTDTGRYGLHDLVRSYAAGRGRDEDAPPERRAALTRLFDHYLATAAAAMDTLRPAEAHRRPRVPAPATPIPDLSDPDTARAWLDRVRPTIGTVAAYAATHGWPTHTTRLAATLFRYLTGGYHDDALRLHDHARRAARRSADPVAEAEALTNLGATYVQLGRYAVAAGHLDQALERYRRTGDQAGQARVLTNLGVVAERRGRFGAAGEHYARAHELHHACGDHTGEARALGNLGIIEARLGHCEQAADHLRQARHLCRRIGDRAGEASHLNNLGDVEGRLGRPEAAEHLRQALARYRELADPLGEAGTLDSLGVLATRQGRPDEAREHFESALRIVRAVRDPQGEACALNGLGEAAAAADRPDEARGHHGAARVIATTIGDRYQQARADAGIGRALERSGDPARAREHLAAARATFADLGLPPPDTTPGPLSTGAGARTAGADSRSAGAGPLSTGAGASGAGAASGRGSATAGPRSATGRPATRHRSALHPTAPTGARPTAPRPAVPRPPAPPSPTPVGPVDLTSIDVQ